MARMKILEILKDQTITTQFDFVGSCPNDEGDTVTFTVFNTAFFLNELYHRFFSREINIVDPDNAFTEFCGIFNVWKAARGPMYARLAYAYSLGYNPIENYLSVERTEGKDKLTHGLATERTYTNFKVDRTHNDDAVSHTYDPTDGDAVERTYTNYKEKTQYNSEKDTYKTSRYGVNSSEKVGVTEDENTKTGDHEVTTTGSYKDKHTGGYTDTHSGGYSDETSGKYKDANSGTDMTVIEHETTRHGNIGVMTASQMIQSLYDGLIQDLSNRALCDFLDRYTFVCEGVTLW